jgi:putative spermidine/putrescine transport system substrate-binding protein
MTGWADTWMMSAHAQHPNCMMKWMGWMLTPQVQAQVAESFGESPANP